MRLFMSFPVSFTIKASFTRGTFVFLLSLLGAPRRLGTGRKLRVWRKRYLFMSTFKLSLIWTVSIILGDCGLRGEAGYWWWPP
jgi:hypothetical protein